ncbi:MAG TPA: hypothetical protein PKV17_11970, partial [Aquabacterium sp.]|nr:hypothetical protein [Aquabacterium sp.]
RPWRSPTCFLWAWDEATFLRLTEGSPIRRIGFGRWQRNLAVAMGNALHGDGAASSKPLQPATRQAIEQALQQWLIQPPAGADLALVTPHVQWALAPQRT